MQINANNVVIPSNTSQGLFTHAAADNWNRTTDAIIGEHLTYGLIPSKTGGFIRRV